MIAERALSSATVLGFIIVAITLVSGLILMKSWKKYLIYKIFKKINYLKRINIIDHT